jgi:hypothetical protein
VPVSRRTHCQLSGPRAPFCDPARDNAGRQIPHLAGRIPRPLAFAAMLREDQGEGVLVTELVCQSDWRPTDRPTQPTR